MASKQEPVEPEFFRYRDVAQRFGFSEAQIRRWEREGVIRFVHVPGIRSKRAHITEVRSLSARILSGNLNRDPQEAA